MPGAHGGDQLDDEYTGDSDEGRRRRLLGLLRTFKLEEKEFSERYSIDTLLFSWHNFQDSKEPLDIRDEKIYFKVGEVLNTRPRKIKVVYGLERGEENSQLKNQIEGALEFARYLEERKVPYIEEPLREELSKKFSDDAKELNDLARKLR